MSDDANHPTPQEPAEQLTPDEGEAGDTGLVADSEASGGSGTVAGDDKSFSQQEEEKRPGDGPAARD
ncbi:hypothetical protein [Allobranchiibius sp. CTAmp26]|uniref:hypothetical protein n=1 Tax=Allobranchiibius sp. CTAmp26 TaxID=2815214 RepID=UPI001AA0FE4A|nr:hypothetical protein [Allobranchiibius sp. CTAmp26]MBO1753575.1 hypothetical protein [Allobranchiibius sp. CTAmp26]